MSISTKASLGLLLAGFAWLSGCEKASVPPPKDNSAQTAIRDERAKLTVEERVKVDSQDWCPIHTANRLGSMGPPIPLEIKGQIVFLCCEGCIRKAESDPDKTLAKLAELKTKVSAQKVTEK